MKIGIASDHRGYTLKEYLKKELTKLNYEVEDYGTTGQTSTDYPDYAFALGENVANKRLNYGIAICGSGIGISIACNKVKGVRCAKVDSIEDVIATRNDNDANVIAFGEKMSQEKAKELVLKFIETPWSTEEKHHRRVAKITDYEDTHYVR